jgi:hypothetical protein
MMTPADADAMPNMARKDDAATEYTHHKTPTPQEHRPTPIRAQQPELQGHQDQHLPPDNTTA